GGARVLLWRCRPQVVEPFGASALASVGVDRAVDDDPFQPRAKRTVRVVPGELAERATDRVLRDVLRVDEVAGGEVCPTPGERPVALVALGDGVAGPAPGEA